MGDRRVSCWDGTSKGRECRYNVLLKVHFVFLVGMISLVWCVLSLPIVFFNMPPEISVPTTNLSESGNKCSEETPGMEYETVQVCQQLLVGVFLSHNCSPPTFQQTLVFGAKATEVQFILKGVELLRPSTQCKEEVLPFLCVHLLSICSDSGEPLQPSRSQCENIRDNVCSREWQEALTFKIDLPTCSSLPESSSYCDHPSERFNDSNGTDENTLSWREFEKEEEAAVECSPGFYNQNSSSCLPSCYSWSQYSREVTVASDVLVMGAAIIGVVVSIAIFVLSCLCHRRMLEYPSVLIIFMISDTTVIAITLIVSQLDRKRLYCSSMNLLESFQLVTPFCVISGIILEYTSLQLALWWLFHILMLFLKILFPFHELSLGKSTKSRVFHRLLIAMGLILPIAPIIASMVDFAIKLNDSASSSQVTFWSGGLGFSLGHFPPTPCHGRKNVVFYFFSLPIYIIIASGCTLLLIIMWSLHRQHIQKKISKSNTTLQIGKVEIKLMVVLIYYIVLVSILLSTLTVFSRNFTTLKEAMIRYFSCEVGGNNQQCSLDDIDRLSHPFLLTSTYFFICMLPVFNLIYVVNVKEIKDTLRKWKRTKKRMQSVELSKLEL